MSLGAVGTFVGRPVLWALSVNGADGVQNMLNILGTEFSSSMKLTGMHSIAEFQADKELTMYKNDLYRVR
ncbi:hypothetical protein WR25_24886 [Diploscapter pachys]|uniref:FMN-dependent dehydrogenase domain-containing protein n=1 Tax=Diploscapter pachys TaxID=2018661 RepID=A0A2A2LHM4_9BILA|nr:hypothetical protein WR25_24886 [Diploscapter pachys]